MKEHKTKKKKSGTEEMMATNHKCFWRYSLEAGWHNWLIYNLFFFFSTVDSKVDKISFFLIACRESSPWFTCDLSLFRHALYQIYPQPIRPKSWIYDPPYRQSCPKILHFLYEISFLKLLKALGKKSLISWMLQSSPWHWR